MGYPTSAIVFTTKNAGDVIQPAHVNDMQTEITALEQALLTGGLAHNLNPSGDSTRLLGSSGTRWIIHGSQLSTGTVPIAALQSTAGTPSTATFYRGDGVWVAPPVGPFISALVEFTGNVSVSTNAYVGISWDSEVRDVSGMHSTSVNSSRLTCVSTGLFMVGASVQWSPSTTANNRRHELQLFLNDTTVFAGASQPTLVDGQNILAQTVSGMVNITSTADYVTVRVWQNTDETLSLIAASTGAGHRFWAHQVST